MSAHEDIEFKLLVDALYCHYGFDFRGYAQTSFQRRLNAVVSRYKLRGLSQLHDELLRSADFFSMVLPDLTVTTTEMFRDPQTFRMLRQEVMPILGTYPTLKIWHAGCSSGEEVYALAIVLKEMGLLRRSIIYATDLNPRALAEAKNGIYPVGAVKKFTANYYESGGECNFSEYYTAAYGRARFDPDLRANVVFAAHNLATDDVFSTMNLILCRNVLIYFDRGLQDRTLDLLARSLGRRGFLCLGPKESLRFSSQASYFDAYPGNAGIYQKNTTAPAVSVLVQRGGDSP